MNTLMTSGPLPRIRFASKAVTARVSSTYPRETKKYCWVIRRRSRSATACSLRPAVAGYFIQPRVACAYGILERIPQATLPESQPGFRQRG